MDWPMSRMTTELDEVKRNNVLVQKMLEEELPFTRETYLALFFGDERPSPWTTEHEGRLPPVFRNHDNDTMHRAIEGLGNAIGIAYNGEIPR